MLRLNFIYLLGLSFLLASCTLNDPKFVAGKVVVDPASLLPSTPTTPVTNKNKITITADKATLFSDETIQLKLSKTNSDGNTTAFDEGSDEVEFVISNGTSTGTFSTITKKRDGIFYVNFKGVLAGTAVTVQAKINGVSVADNAPTLTVVPGAPASISVSSGSDQTGAVNSALASPLVAIVNDAQGNLVNGATIDWSITSGGGALTSASSVTASTGLASNNLNLGTATGTTVVRALINGTSISTNFTVSATADTALLANSSIATSTTQVLADGNAASTITITLKDQYNNPLVGVVPTFSATNTSSGNQYSACSSSSSSGISTCSLTSTYGETKTVSLVTPIAITGNSVKFYGGAAVPTITAIPDVYSILDSASVTFTIADADDTLTCTSAGLVATSSNTTLLPVANIVFSGTGTSCTATLTPVTNLSGTTTIQISITDGVHSGSRSFNFTVAPLPSIAYSVRKVIPSYSGPAMRVRRSSDNTESNIGFTAGGELDTAALLTFVGAGDGYVKTWYDQTGRGENLSNLINSTQPLIAVAGAVTSSNSKPSIYFNGVSNSTTAFDALYLPAQRVGDGFISAVMSFTPGNDGFILSDMLAYDFYSNPANNSLTYPTADSSSSPAYGAKAYSDSVFYLNGTRFQNYNITTGSLAPFVTQLTTIQIIPAFYPNTQLSLKWDNLGSDRSQYHALNGKYSELIVYKNFPGYETRLAVEALARNYFGTTYTPVSTNIYSGTAAAIPTGAEISGTQYTQSGQCYEYRLTLTASNAIVAPVSVPTSFTLGVPSVGAFYSDSSCTNVSNNIVTIPAGEISQSFFFKASPSSFTAQTFLAVGPYPVSSQYVWHYTSPLTLSSATLSIAPSTNIEPSACSRIVLGLTATSGTTVPYPTPTAATFTLGGNTNSGVTYGAYYTDQTCTTPTTTVTIPVGASQVTYYYYSAPPTTSKSMTLSVTGIRNKTIGVTLKAPPYFNSIAMTVLPSYLIDPNVCTKVAFDTKDQYYNNFPLTSTTTMTLSGNTQGAFYSDPGCTTTITSLSVPSGQYHGEYYYKGPTTASNVDMSFGLSGGGVSGTVTARLKGTPVYTYISWTMYSANIGVCTAAPIEFRDQNWLSFTTTATANSTITPGNLYGNFYTDSTCTTTALTRSVPAGSTSQTLYYKASSYGCADGSITFNGVMTYFSIETSSCACGCGD